MANRITNISRGGLFIEKILPLYADVDLSFRLPGSDVTIDARGRVVWTYDIRKDSYHLVEGSGIRFVEMRAEERQILEEYLRKLTPNPTPRDPQNAEAV